MLAVPARIAGCRSACCARRRGPTDRRIPRCSWPRGCAASNGSSSSAARRPSPRWRTARRRCRRSTRSSGPAMPGSPRPSSSSRPTPTARRSTCRPDRPKCWSSPTSGATGLRRGRPAGAGRAQRGRAGRAGHDVARVRRGLHRRGRAPDGDAAPTRHRGRVDRREPRASSCPISRRHSTCRNRYAPEHLILQVALAARLAAARAQRRLGVPRRVDAGDHGRLLQRHQSRAADLRPRPRLQRPRRARLREAHDGAGSDARRPRRPRARPPARWRASKRSTRTRTP